MNPVKGPDWTQSLVVLTALGLLSCGWLVTGNVLNEIDFFDGHLVTWPWLVAALVIAWLGSRLTPWLVRWPWVGTGLAVLSFLSPLFFGIETVDRTTGIRSISLGSLGLPWGYGYWLEPGVVGILFLVPLLVVLSARIGATNLARWVVLQAGVLWLVATLLLGLGNRDFAFLLLGAGLVGALLARPRGLALGLQVSLLALILAWSGFLAVMIPKPDSSSSGFCLETIDWLETLPRTWHSAGWWGFPPTTTQWDLSIPMSKQMADILTAPAALRLPSDPDYLINATAQLYGWTGVAIVMGTLLLHLWALVRLARRARGPTLHVARWTGWVYASIAALMAGMSLLTSAGWLSWPWPSTPFPWLAAAKDVNSLFAMAWLCGGVFGLARLSPAVAVNQGESDERRGAG
jgi:hypothetical protein